MQFVTATKPSGEGSFLNARVLPPPSRAISLAAETSSIEIHFFPKEWSFSVAMGSNGVFGPCVGRIFYEPKLDQTTELLLEFAKTVKTTETSLSSRSYHRVMIAFNHIYCLGFKHEKKRRKETPDDREAKLLNSRIKNLNLCPFPSKMTAREIAKITRQTQNWFYPFLPPLLKVISKIKFC